MIYVNSLGILSKIWDWIKSIGNFLSNLWDMLVSAFTNIGSLISFIFNGVSDTLNLLISSMNFLGQFYAYVPPFASGFLAIFVAGVTINIILEIT